MNKITEVAIYARLSNEDRDILKRNSGSINNQIEICKRYILEHNMLLKDVFIDDGVTGTTYNRPGFNALIEGIERKRFNAVIVKDLSRLGRNFLKSSYYIEEYFPEHSIRFISINDGYDSFSSKDGEMLIAISNYLNGYYAKECRKKKQLYFQSIANKEAFITHTLGAYGYIVYKKEVTIDPYAARIVRKIFRMRGEHISHKKIALYLTSKKILTPGEYKKKRRGKPFVLKPWTRDKVMDIIFNPIYQGDAYNFARSKASGINRRQPINKRIVIKNTHPAIISRKMFKNAHYVDTEFKPVYCHEPYEKLSKFFFGENGLALTAFRKKSYYKVKEGIKSKIDYFYRNRIREYYFKTSFAHEKIYEMAIDLIQEIKSDGEAYYNKMIAIYKDNQESISNKLSIIKERDKLNDEYQSIFEANASGVIDDIDFVAKVSSINIRIKEIDETLLRYFDIEYKEKDFRRRLSDYVVKIKVIDESLPKLNLVKTVFKTCKVIKNSMLDITFIPELNLQ